MNKGTILLVEDDTDLSDITAQYLELRQFRVLTVATYVEGAVLFHQESVSLVLLDIILPDGSGLDLLSWIRRTSSVPIILMTSLGQDDDVVRGLAMGANDYISKPCALEVVLARIETQLEMAMYDMRGRVRAGAITLDKSKGRAYLGRTDLSLTPREFSLLLYFAQRVGQTLSFEQIFRDVWGQPLNNDTTALRSHVYALRKKLGSQAGVVIDTVDRNNYVFW